MLVFQLSSHMRYLYYYMHHVRLIHFIWSVVFCRMMIFNRCLSKSIFVLLLFVMIEYVLVSESAWTEQYSWSSTVNDDNNVVDRCQVDITLLISSLAHHHVYFSVARGLKSTQIQNDAKYAGNCDAC
jgi:Na+-transporting NADH:ubiquinone oxidoreductase subunit NqrF